MTAPAPASSGRAPAHLHGWRHRTVLAVAGLSAAAGFAQFAVIASLGDVGEAFAVGESDAVLGLSGTALGAGLGIIRLAALGGLPLAALADRSGRKRILLVASAVGLALTSAGAVSPAYWIFVALFAAARPLLSATNALCNVIAAEETDSVDRAKAIALITLAYGTGAGIAPLARALGGDALGVRGLFALALVPLAALPFLARLLHEPERFALVGGDTGRFRLGRVRRDLVPRLATMGLLAAAAAFTTSPVNAYVFAYAERVLGLPRSATAVLVVPAAVLGFAGLTAGRWAADRLGRRSTSVVMHLVVGAAATITYADRASTAITGYLLGLLAGAAYAPAIGALSTELFPTSERATAVGWLTAASAVGAVAGLFAFGRLVDVLADFTVTALLISVPVIVTAPLYFRLPETRGLELEESAPE